MHIGPIIPGQHFYQGRLMYHLPSCADVNVLLAYACVLVS